MATTYTLDEAAQKLGITAEELKKKLQTEWTHVRPMRDRGTILLKVKDVEELARQLGFGSEEELQLADPSSGEHRVPPALSGKTPAAAPVADDPLILGDQDVFLMADEGKPAAKSPSGKSKTKTGSDSDVRLEKSGKVKAAPKPDDSGTEEIELDVLPPTTSPSGKLSGSGKLTSSKSGKVAPGGSGSKVPATGSKSGKLPVMPEEDSSEFELTLDTDSSDEFELSLATDSSDEISLGDVPAAPAPGGKGGQSGINIGKPSDSGPSLEKKGGASSGKIKTGDSGRKSGKLPATKSDTGSDEEIDFELSLDQPGSSRKKAGSKSGKKVDSDSEFELTLDDASLGSDLEAETAAFEAAGEQKNDIFETDFEIPALDDDSSSEAVAIDEADTDLESSDFDLAIDEADVSVDDESASQVVVLDDETGPPAAKKKSKLKSLKSKPTVPVREDDEVEVTADDVVADDAVSFDEMELDESESASKALKGARAETEEEEDEEKGTVVVAQTAPWGVFPALLMLPTVFVIFLGGIMAYELVHSMWGYHQPTPPASLVVDNVAKTFDLQPKE